LSILTEIKLFGKGKNYGIIKKMSDELGFFHRPTFRYFVDLIEVWCRSERKWQTDKARIESLVEFIPRKFRIHRLVFKKEDKQKIQKAMLQAIKEGFWVGVRSCYLYQPLGKAPWIMAMKSKKAVSLFFSRQKGRLWLGTPAHYYQWLADPGLKEMIIMFNPKRLCPQYKKEHFVCRIEHFEDQIRAEIRLYTDQTRDIEAETDRKNLIQITAPINYTLYLAKKLPLTASFGSGYFKRKISLDKETKKKLTVEMFDGQFGHFQIKNPKYRNLIKPSVLKITQQIANRIFNHWLYPPFNLYYRLQALREFGLGTVEVQGRMEKGKIAWMLVYGLRGLREVEKINTK